MNFTNIAAYQFAKLEDLKILRKTLLDQCKADGLKGTILLSTEGINLFLAGSRAGIDRILALIHSIPSLEKLAAKFSESEHQPFSRMLVRIKREIISFGIEGIAPGVRTSPKLSPRELKSWLDQGRPLTLLDTRNDYEFKLGTFTGATTLPINHFRQFPDAIKSLPEELKKAPVIMFCTGGIRCEKAGPFMEREGFENILQLDGGILKYFEEVGGDHYQGECFVFDHRVGVDPTLQETKSVLCFACQTPLTVKEQADPRYVPDVSCPHCYQTQQEVAADRLASRQSIIDKICQPPPGSVPRIDRIPFLVSPESHGSSLKDCLLAGDFPPSPIENASGKLCPLNQVVNAGEKYFRVISFPSEPAIDSNIRLLHEDDALIIFEKPANLPAFPSDLHHRNTLQHIVHQAYAPQKPHIVLTPEPGESGLVVCARTRRLADLLRAQFAASTSQSPLILQHPLTNEEMIFRSSILPL